MPILQGLIGAVIYAGTMYIKKWKAGQQFDLLKFGSTLLLGLVIGVIMLATKMGFSEVNIAQQYAIYVAFVGVVENVLQFIIRTVKKRAG